MRGGPFRTDRQDLPTHERIPVHEGEEEEWMVGPFTDGEWLSYSIEIPEGCFELFVRIREGGGTLKVELDEETRLESQIFSNGFWTTQRIGKIEIGKEQAGRKNLRLYLDGPYRLSRIEFRPCRRKSLVR